MRAMVLAAGLGTRLRPLTYEITKPMVPVLDRPVMEHILDLLDRHGFEEVIANLHYFPESIREHFGDRLAYRFEEELLGTAGGVRACADFFGDEPFLVISGDALTDIDLGALAARHPETGGIATLAVKKVSDTREYGVVLHDRDGRITGFQEKPEPEEALSDLGNCGIYVFEPQIFEYFPSGPSPTGRRTCSRRCSRTTSRSTSTRSRVLERRRLAERAAAGHLRRAARRAAPADRGRGGEPRRDRRGRRLAAAGGHRGRRARLDRARRPYRRRVCA